MEKFPITTKGFDRLEKELRDLRLVERPKISQDIATAREHGDLSENAEYDAALDRQAIIEARILSLKDKVARAEKIEIGSLSGDVVTFGATVTLMDLETEKKVMYHIVGEYEADLAKNRISIVSPIAKALIGKTVKDIAEVMTPKGVREYEILQVEYKELDDDEVTPRSV